MKGENGVGKLKATGGLFVLCFGTTRLNEASATVRWVKFPISS